MRSKLNWSSTAMRPGKRRDEMPIDETYPAQKRHALHGGAEHVSLFTLPTSSLASLRERCKPLPAQAAVN